ncbi:PCC domain-containing protein [Prochlorococcus sp. MIT 1341]|uniref:PCC domain-containing protein n=1 Tax=Prochlorococcus sp. MIT 1341 TaxID=3096221 RepID=UPI002A751E1C|nr:DUF296 domain-containing protein [Prochlorococcus sp. MIT 1341]
MESLPLQLSPGCDLRGSLEDLGRQYKENGFVLGVVGNLSRAAFQCPGNPEPTILEGNLEIITLNGTVSPSGVHLHLSISDGACQVWGGHLEPGSLVLKGADILVGFHTSNFAIAPSLDSPYETKSPRLRIAVIAGCPWSARALRLLRPLGIPFSIETIEEQVDFEKLRQITKSETFPQIFIDDNFIGGYEALVEIHGSGKLEDLR